MNGLGPDHVLVVYAHPNLESFTHAVLDQIVRGPADVGHTRRRPGTRSRPRPG